MCLKNKDYLQNNNQKKISLFLPPFFFPWRGHVDSMEKETAIQPMAWWGWKSGVPRSWCGTGAEQAVESRREQPGPEGVKQSGDWCV